MKSGIKFGIVIAVFAAALVPAQAAFAKSYTVTKTTDHAPGACTHSDCTLREAVIDANAHIGSDVIVLARGKHYGFQIAGTDNAAAMGDLDITDTLTIKRGAAHSRKQRKQLATVDGQHVDRVFQVIGNPNFTLNGIAVTGGESSNDDGGISGNDGQLTLIGCLVKANTGNGDVGGIDSATGPLKLVRTTIKGNRGDQDGGLYAFGRATLLNSKVIGNKTDANTGVGGMDMHGVENSFRNSTFSRNEGGIGALDMNMSPGATLTIAHSQFTTNIGDNDVAGIDATGTVSITDSSFTGNTSHSSGGAIWNADFMTIDRSTFAENKVLLGTGGGIENHGDQLTVRNSTIVNNSAAGSGGGFAGSGPAVFNNVTIARNHANSDNTGADWGGGLSVNPGPFTISNSIIALNTIGTGGTDPNCHGPFLTAGHNLRGTADTNCAGFFAISDFVKANPKLGLLRKNGGPTLTVALLKGSPAINKGGSDGEPRDQRGVKHKGLRDIGAFEYKPKPKHHKH